MKLGELFLLLNILKRLTLDVFSEN